MRSAQTNGNDDDDNGNGNDGGDDDDNACIQQFPKNVYAQLYPICQHNGQQNVCILCCTHDVSVLVSMRIDTTKNGHRRESIERIINKIEMPTRYVNK